MIIAIVLYGFFTAVKAPQLPAGAVPAPVPMSPGPQMVVSGIGAFLLMLLGFLCLPAVVMLPWLLMFLGRRSALIGSIAVPDRAAWLSHADSSMRHPPDRLAGAVDRL
jgi:hypothetical protein